MVVVDSSLAPWTSPLPERRGGRGGGRCRDPFMYLSLSVPSTAKRAMTVTVFSTDGSTGGCSYDLFQALSIACSLGDDKFLLVTGVRFPFPISPFEPLEIMGSLSKYKIL
jgi:hypothetical protein